MADENSAPEEKSEESTAQTEPQKPETDWKAEARKWESRAKQNKEKADELDKLKEAQMTETEKLQKEVEQWKSKASDLEREKERNSWVEEVAKETGLSTEQLKAIAANTKEELLERALLFAKKEETKSVPVVLGDGNHAQHKPAQSGNDWLRSTIH